jgi:methionyl-tRNA formyltransferase
MRVLFWGTPEFATPPLRALIGEGFDVAAVVTQPDRPVGRSRSTLQPPAVKMVATEEGLPVLQPERPRGDDFLAALSAFDADISVVVAYGHILPQAVIDLPRLGTLNIHASLLPKLRGAAPIQAAIREGLTETGVSIMRMVPALDAGPVIHRVATPIASDETGGELAVRLAEIGALALVEAMAMIDIGQAVAVPQNDAEATYAPKITREATRVSWQAPAVDVARQIRAYDPRPGAFAVHRGSDVKLFGAHVVDGVDAGEPGLVLRIDDGGMIVACGDGKAVAISAAQPSGKRRLTPLEWSHGRGIAGGERLS